MGKTEETIQQEKPIQKSAQIRVDVEKNRSGDITVVKFGITMEFAEVSVC